MRFVLVAAAFLMLGCGGNSTPTAPTPPPVAACQANNTAEVTFGNRSQRATQDVLWDNSFVATIAPGQNTAPRTVAAGVAHTLLFRVTNTVAVACVQSSPTLARCDAQIYTCAFP